MYTNRQGAIADLNISWRQND